MSLVKKEIRYIGRDFGKIRENLINFAKSYFPNTYNDFNEASPGMMMLETAAYVGDVLSYYTDHQLKESLLNRTEEIKNLYALSSTLGYKPKNVMAASVTLDVFQLLPAAGSGTSISPDWNYAMNVRAGMAVKASKTPAEFRTVEPVDFKYSSSLSPTEVLVYSVSDTTGEPEYYLLKKSVKALSGKIATSTYTFSAPRQYDKIVINDSNIIEIIDIVDSDGNTWYEVPYLAQDAIFESIQNTAQIDPELSVYRDSAPYLLKMKKTARRFITRFTSKDNLEIQFGSGISEDADEEIIPSPDIVGNVLPGRDREIDTSIDPSNFLYTRTYGQAPSNTTLTVRYTTGLGVNDNVPASELTDIINLEIDLDESGLDTSLASQIKASVAATNPGPARGGASKEQPEEIRSNALANFAAQNRTVTKEDYIVRAYSMPPRFGSIAKAYVVQDDQLVKTENSYDRIANPFALNLYILGYDADGKLTQLNDAVKENLKTYIGEYRILTDAINIKDAYIVNIGIDFEVVPLPRYNANEVILRCIEKLKSIFNIKKWQINEPIVLSKLRVELDKVEGVQTVHKVEITNKIDMDLGYSGNIYSIEGATRNGTIYPSIDPMCWEIKYLNSDIRGRTISI